MTDLEGQIKVLVELQGFDSRIFRGEDELEAIPERIKSLENEYREKAGNLKDLEDALKALQMKRKDKEGDLDAREGAIKKYQQQLNQVKTNKEYSALQEEIGRAKADSSIVEEEIINILDQIDAHMKKVSVEKECLKQEESKLGEEKKRLSEEAVRVKADTEELKSGRAQLALKADKVILAKYERIVRKKDGLAVVMVVNDACQGCFRVMPPQVINEVRMKNDLVLCENCARILYIED